MRLSLRTMFKCVDVRSRLIAGDLDSPLHFAQVLRNQLKIRQCRARNRLLVLLGEV